MKSFYPLAYWWWRRWLQKSDRELSAQVQDRIQLMNDAVRRKDQPEMWRQVNFLRQYDGICVEMCDRIVMRVEIGWAMKQIGQVEKALEVLYEAQLFAYSEPDLFGWIHLLLGCLNWERDRPPQAFKDWAMAQKQLKSYAQSYSEYPLEADWLSSCNRRILRLTALLAEKAALQQPMPGWFAPPNPPFSFVSYAGPGLDAHLPSNPQPAPFPEGTPIETGVETAQAATAEAKTQARKLTPAILQFLNMVDAIPAGERLLPNQIDPEWVGGDHLIIGGEAYYIYSLDGRRAISLRDQRNCFILNVHGNSMNLRGISDGDYVLIRKTQQAHNGDIVAAGVRENEIEATLKEYLLASDGVYLIFRSDLPEFQDKQFQIENPDRDLAIWGIVIAVLKLS